MAKLRQASVVCEKWSARKCMNRKCPKLHPSFKSEAEGMCFMCCKQICSFEEMMSQILNDYIWKCLAILLRTLINVTIHLLIVFNLISWIFYLVQRTSTVLVRSTLPFKKVVDQSLFSIDSFIDKYFSISNDIRNDPCGKKRKITTLHIT